MTALVSLLWRICLLRSGPETVPASNFLLGLLIAVNAAISWIATIILQAMIPIPEELSNQLSAEQLAALSDGFLLFTRVVVTLACSATLIWGLLTLMNFQERTNKVLCAVFGTFSILTTVRFIATLIGLTVHPTVVQLVSLGMLFWTVAVLGFILHRALEISNGFGIAAALFILTFTFAVGQVVVTG